jgi:hypothetical protein
VSEDSRAIGVSRAISAIGLCLVSGYADPKGQRAAESRNPELHYISPQTELHNIQYLKYAV